MSTNPLKDIECPRPLSRARLAGGPLSKGLTYTCVCAYPVIIIIISSCHNDVVIVLIHTLLCVMCTLLYAYSYLLFFFYFLLQTRVQVGRRRNRDPYSRRHGPTSLSTRTPVRRCMPNGIVSTTPRVSPSKSANRCCITASECTRFYEIVFLTFSIGVR